jgi:predicted MFS family arabinose efflux permease
MENRSVVVGSLGIVQIISWGTTYYFPAAFLQPITADTGWSTTFVSSGLSIGLLVAALVSPSVGTAIVASGGRKVLASASILIALGLVTISLALSQYMYILGWILLGIGMGGGLYDSAFATLSGIYGQSARRSFSALTIYGGFASTICWPLSAIMIEYFGWRTACQIYALIHVSIGLPLLLMFVPAANSELLHQELVGGGDNKLLQSKALFVVVSAAIASGAFMTSSLAVQLLILLQAGGMSYATAVTIGMIIGPAQVISRVIEMRYSRHSHPLWTMLASSAFMTVGLSFLGGSVPVLIASLALYAAGNGLWSIVRGSVPLVVLGANRYRASIGHLVRPALLASAGAPLAIGFIYESGGAAASQTALICSALVTLSLVLSIFLLAGPRVRSLSSMD